MVVVLSVDLKGVSFRIYPFGSGERHMPGDPASRGVADADETLHMQRIEQAEREVRVVLHAVVVCGVRACSHGSNSCLCAADVLCASTSPCLIVL